MKKVCISVINDLATDQRVLRVIDSLVRDGFLVTFIGRRRRGSPDPGNVSWKYKRFRFIFNRGPCFYLFYNTRLFLYLLFKARPDLLISNDLDTLPANFLVSRLRSIPIIYDSHEYFTQVPELIERKRVQKIWEWLESIFIPRLDHAVTVSRSIARDYTAKYEIEFRVVRNLPFKREPVLDPELRKMYQVKKIIIYQGALNTGRGLELMIRTMPFLSDCVFLIAGDGDITEELKSAAGELGLEERVRFLGRMTPEKLYPVTCSCDLGISLEEDRGLNYRYALPNKLFDYIQARIPVLCSDLPEMREIIKRYDTGLITLEQEPGNLAAVIREMLADKNRGRWKNQLEKAANELCWENESENYMEIVRSVVSI